MRLGVSFLWGLFCTNSWTWCIGMYLPVIMIDRFGWPGFWAFAVPNVLGCAAFGYTVRTRARSEAMVVHHGRAMTWFSIVTIAYHVFFIVWLLAELVPVPREMYWAPLAASAVVLGLGAVLSFLPDRDWLAISVIVFAVSLSGLVLIGFDGLHRIPAQGEMSRAALGWLTPTLVFGFLLSPYLDLTFHRALQRSPSRHSFGVFGAGFALMLVLTCTMWHDSARMLPSIAIAHLFTQTVFTVGAHMREVRLSQAIRTAGTRMLAMTSPLLAAPLLYLGRLFTSSGDFGETTYLRFLVFYGLVFPAYALLVMRAGRSALAWSIIVVVSLPLYEAGFILGHTWLLIVPLGAMVLVSWKRPGGSDNASRETLSTESPI